MAKRRKYITFTIVLLTCIPLIAIVFLRSSEAEPEEPIITQAELAAPYIEELERLQQEWNQSILELVEKKLELDNRIKELANPPPSQIIEVIKEKRIIVHEEIPVKLTDWANLEALEVFIDKDEVGDTNNTDNITSQLDFALQLSKSAASQFKRIFIVLFEDEVICGALVDKSYYYYIRPKTDEIWLGKKL